MSTGVKMVKAKRALGIVFLAALFLSVMLMVSGPTPAYAWQSWGGGLSSSPDSSWFYDTYQYALVRGNDNQLWYRQGINGSPAGDWVPLGGVLTSGPSFTAAPNPLGPIDMFVRGADGALWWRHGYQGGLGPWQSLGGIITSGPDAFEGPVGVFVCARGADNALWYRVYADSWGPWGSLGGNLTSDPGIAYAGLTYLFARGADNALWMRTPSSGWQSLGGTLASGPDASFDSERLVVAALGTDGAVWYRTHTGTTWSEWYSLGGQGTSDPSLAGSQGGVVTGVTYAFVRGTDGQLWETEVP